VNEKLLVNEKPFALSVARMAREVEALAPSTSALRAYAQGERLSKTALRFRYFVPTLRPNGYLRAALKNRSRSA
jgi:hypothetical protein